ncbi:MAG TPA: NUDIX hydrolase, partial [Pseudomonas sp.]|nr:NUDIX hydrolase [Pseudomonas sp.]
MDQQHIVAYLQASGSERVIHVDEQDRELGVVSRADAQSRGLITRCTF